MTISHQYGFEILTESHDISGFDCQNMWLNNFLRNDALTEQRQDLSRTYVLVDTTTIKSESVIGFFTLKATSQYIASEDGSRTIEIPLVEVVYLARDKQHRGSGVGGALLFAALVKIAEVSERIGVAGAFLITTDEGRKLYERHGFASFDGIDATRRLILPIGELRSQVNTLLKETQSDVE